MSSPEQKKCNQCLTVFSPEKRPLRMPACRHNICEQCLQQIKQSKIDVLQCQFCEAAPARISKWKFQYNRLIMNKFKQEKKKHVQKSSETSVSMNASIKAQQEDLADSDGNQFLLTQDTPEGKKIKSQDRENEVCPEHDKPFEIICVSDLRMICPHCAIFGNHKDHCFKTLKQFKKDEQQKYEKVQAIQQQKYLNDKRLKNLKSKQNIETIIESRKISIRKEISTIFEKLITDIQQLEVKICQDLNKAYSAVYKDIILMLDQEAKVSTDYNKWESECQNYLQSLSQNMLVNDRIKVLYGPLTKVVQGQQLVDKLDKKLDLQTKKVSSLVNSVLIDFKDGLDFSKFIKITRKQEDSKKQNIVQSIQKLTLPIGKHVIQDIDFGENSFLADYQRQQLSLLIDGQSKRGPTKSVMSKRTPLSKTLASSQKFRSPNKKNQMGNQSMLSRCKSNGDVKLSELMQNTSTSNILQTSLVKIEIRELQSIVSDFLKHDLKQVLDLSRCDLNDEAAVSTLRQIRKHRKIRGLKLCQNYITDKGFESILVQVLGSTSNLNISYNRLTEQSLSLMIKNRDKISPLRIVNMSFNNLNEKKSKTRIDALKKMGIIVNV